MTQYEKMFADHAAREALLAGQAHWLHEADTAAFSATRTFARAVADAFGQWADRYRPPRPKMPAAGVDLTDPTGPLAPLAEPLEHPWWTNANCPRGPSTDVGGESVEDLGASDQVNTSS